MSFVVYFRAWIFSSVFFSRVGFWFLSLISGACFANTWGGLAKVLSLIVVPFLCVPNFAQIFPAALLGDSNCKKKLRKSAKTCEIFNWNRPRGNGRKRNENRASFYKLIISLLKRRKHSHKLKGVWKLHRFVLPPVRFM